MNGSAPRVRLTLADSAAPWALQSRVLSFSLSLQANATDRLVLTAYNDDLALFGHQALQHGTALDVRWGYADILAGPRRVHFEDFKGCTELSLEFSGAERPMNQKQRTRAWADKSVADVVCEVAAENGFSDAWSHIESAGTNPVSITQAGETDAALLQRLAQSHGFTFYVANDGLHWERPRKASLPVATLRYATSDANVLSLSVTSNQARQAGRVEVRTRDPIERKTVVAAANNDTPRETLGQTVEVVDPQRFATAIQQQNATQVVAATAKAPVEAKQEAEARFAAGEASVLEVRAVIIGDPALHGGQIVRLTTPARYLNGNYFVQEAKHIIDASGYRTDLHLTRDGAGPREGSSSALQGGTLNDKTAPERIEVFDPQARARSQQ